MNKITWKKDSHAYFGQLYLNNDLIGTLHLLDANKFSFTTLDNDINFTFDVSSELINSRPYILCKCEKNILIHLTDKIYKLNNQLDKYTELFNSLNNDVNHIKKELNEAYGLGIIPNDSKHNDTEKVNDKNIENMVNRFKCYLKENQLEDISESIKVTDSGFIYTYNDNLDDAFKILLHYFFSSINKLAIPGCKFSDNNTEYFVNILEPVYPIARKWNDYLPQYHFEREDFNKCLFDVFTTDQWWDIESYMCSELTTVSFKLFKVGDEFYIIHLDSGTIINYYKHTGRTNTCNNSNFTLNDFKDFLESLKEELVENNFI